MGDIRQYTIYKDGLFEREVFEVVNELGLAGTEVFMDDIVPRDEPLFKTEAEKSVLVERLRALCVRRLHCSYWAWQTNYIALNNFAQLVERFGSLDAVKAYYGDLTATHMYDRWAAEYELACALGADTFTFHLIDYAPIDGRWAFTISKADIRQAMVYMIQRLLNLLDDRGLLGADSPRIEIENAGWGLEHGTQTADDYKMLFNELYDRHDKVRAAWELNHILHAVGLDNAGRGRFMLPPAEITPAMAALETEYDDDPALFAQKWVEYNVLDAELIKKVGSLHVSDCAMKREQYFENGILCEPWLSELKALPDWEAQENYGVDIVLTHYDSHVPLGEGILKPAVVAAMVEKLRAAGADLVVLHELKNTAPNEPALKKQIADLGL